MRVLLLVIFLGLLGYPPGRAAVTGPLGVDSLGVAVGTNREYSFTDKASAYWYGRSRSGNTDWFSGWNVATERIFSDYRLTVGGREADRSAARVTVYPHRIVRGYDWGEETFEMFDQQPVLRIGVRCAPDMPVTLELVGERLRAVDGDGRRLVFRIEGLPGRVLAVATCLPAEARLLPGKTGMELRSTGASGGFLIALDDSVEAATARLELAQAGQSEWSIARAARLNRLLAGNQFRSDDPMLDAALAWNLLTLDALVTRQTGQGIYAGLPWFNDYWGRDMFISLPGTCLVTGQLGVAREILRSFAGFQNRDETSRHLGRVPNRLRPDDIIYNTTDGTPLFLKALLDYVRYSGDEGIVRELYPEIRRSIEGPLRYWVDERGYLTHDDADTWMDARWKDRIPWSPRGNRANDVQALWLAQLEAGARFAGVMHDSASAGRWARAAARLRDSFTRDFVAPGMASMADRLRADGTADFTFRPNQLFALDFLPDGESRARLTRKVWETLVYPWGVASLNQDDPNFHPWLENATYLHKDEAYHNGTVWLWNNGMAMERMLEAGQSAPAFALFRNMSRQSMDSTGAVGALSELNDALPRPGRDTGAPAGTFDQAWSSAEYLRVWHQGFLGLRPDATTKTLTISPRLAGNLTRLEFTVPLWGGRLLGNFAMQGDRATYRYTGEGLPFAPTVRFGLPGFVPQEAALEPGMTLAVAADSRRLTLELLDKDGHAKERREISADETESARQRRLDAIMQGVHFVQPRLNTSLECLQPDHKARLERQLDKELSAPVR